MITIKPDFKSDERLKINNRDAVKALRAAHPKVDKRPPANKRAIAKALGWTGAAVGAMAFIVLVAVPALAPQIAAAIPQEREIALGEQVEDLIERFGLVGEVCTEPEGQAALNAMTAKLTKGLDLRIPIRVDVVEADMVNAVALPGGRVFLFAPLVKQARSPDEIAGVLAHEIGHVQISHPVAGMVRSSASAGVLGLFFGDFMGAGVMAGFAEQFMNASHTREAEREADQFAVERMAAANASTTGMADFFARMREKHGEGGLFGGYMASHPSFSERETMLKTASIGDGAKPILTRAEWKALRNICDSPAEEESNDEVD